MNLPKLAVLRPITTAMLLVSVLVLGFLGATGTLDLPAGLEILSDPLVMLAAGAMYLVEFFADAGWAPGDAA